MEREILFRGKRADNGEWVYGSSLKEKACDGVQHIIVTENGEYHLINPKTRGQYTGLTDRNGVRIFEGDIIDYKNPDGIDKYIVTWDNEYSRFAAAAIWFGETKIIGDFVFYSQSKCTVIGNIHDNPELMKGEK